jgi:hypothetical protein
MHRKHLQCLLFYRTKYELEIFSGTRIIELIEALKNIFVQPDDPLMRNN